MCFTIVITRTKICISFFSRCFRLHLDPNGGVPSGCCQVVIRYPASPPHASVPQRRLFGFFDHRMRCALLSAANQGGKESLSSTASSTRSTDCVAILESAAERRKRRGAPGERDLTQVSSVPSRVGPARHCSQFRHAPRDRSG